MIVNKYSILMLFIAGLGLSPWPACLAAAALWRRAAADSRQPGGTGS